MSTIKFHSNGTWERNKAKVAAKYMLKLMGLTIKTFVLVAKMSTIRVILSIVMNLDW